MFPKKLSRFAFLLMSLALGACASKSAGVLTGNGPARVAAVEVVATGSAISPEFPGQLHDAVVKAGALYGNAGQPLTVKVGLDKVHYKNMLKALVIGDSCVAKGHVSVFDQASGKQMGTFPVMVNAERPTAATRGAGVALFLIECVDPTGAVGMAHTVASASSAAVNRSGAAAGLCANFAAETLRQTFGDARTKAAKLARRQ